MANVEKMFSFPATTTTNSSLKMPQPDCLITPSSTTSVSSCQSSYFKFEQEEEQQQQQQSYLDSNSNALSIQTNDPYATYTDNFDLSLLPQAYTISAAATTSNTTTTTTATKTTNLCAHKTATVAAASNTSKNSIDNIPTTVFNFDKIQTEQKPQLLTVPEIKIEQTWSSCPSLNTIKQEQTYMSYFPQYQLIPPPPAYPVHIYPSPQSSPAQSEYGFPQTQFSGCYESLSSSRNSLYAAAAISPCPSIDVHSIKQEPLHILPPSPPESSCDTPTPQSNCSSGSISGFDFKSEPFDSDVETFTDLNKSARTNTVPSSSNSVVPADNNNISNHQDHQVLREYLEDTTFQKKHNLKPLALDSFIGGLDEVRDNIEPVISLALEHAKREADATCAKLQISQDPSDWTPKQVHAWLRSTIQQFELPLIESIEIKFNENGAELLQLTEDEFARRIPEGGGILHAQLEIWKLTYSDNSHNYVNNNCMQQHQIWAQNTMTAPYNQHMEEDTEEEEDFLPTINNTNGAINNNVNTNNEELPMVTANPVIVPIKRPGARNGGSHIHLWQFLKELLAAPHINGTAIRWIDRSKGIFKIEDSVRVAKLWGKRKNRPAMNYDKLSRSIRQYYKKGIMKKTERSQRLVYQFCQPYHM